MSLVLPTQQAVLSNRSIYGDPRNQRDRSRSSAVWEKSNVVYYKPPFMLYYDGSPCRSGIRIHKYCVPVFALFFEELYSLAKGSETTLTQWGVNKTGGGYNFRLMRGGNNLSMHSYGCAVDLDPAHNGLGDSTPRFLNFPEIAKATKKSGLCWGADWNGNGTTKDTRTWDAMHWQATAPIG